MIDLTSLKAAGWQRVVAELCSPCNDDKQYLDRLLRIIGRVSAARQGVVFMPGPDASSPVQALSIWPAPGAGGEDRVAVAGDAAPIDNAADARSAAAAALESGQARAFGLDRKSALYGVDPEQGYILSVPLLGSEGRPVAAITLLVETRAKSAVQSTLAMAEVLAGYVSGHSARQQLRRTQAASFALDLATRLISSLNTAATFKGAALQLVNDMAKQFKCARAALGWVSGDKIRVVAISDTEFFDRRTAMVQKLESAMDECLDQEQPVVFPPPPADADVLLAQAITHAHRELASGGAGVRICSAPLRDGEKVVGVATLEFAVEGGAAGGGVDLQAVELFQAALDLVAPVVALRKSDDRNIALKARDDLIKAGAWAVGPKHTAWKLAGLTLTAAMFFVFFFHMTYRVGADSTLQPRTQYVVSVPFDGLIRESPEGVEAGKAVAKGDVLARLDTTELELQAEEARQKINKGLAEIASARAQGKTNDAMKADSDVKIAQAALTQAQARIELATIVAPADGQIIAGRLRDRLGSSVKTGDKLFEIAPLDDLILVARVDERDVAFISPGSGGKLATRSHPGEKFDLIVESIVPLAQAEEGKNLFEVRTRLAGRPAIWMRPGMEGIARFDAGRRSLWYIGTRRIEDAIRLWLW